MFIFEYSPWLIPLGILLGILYAFILYWKKNPWSNRTSLILSVIRFLLVLFMFLLLLEPLARQINRNHESPTVVIAVDNSLSVPEVLDSMVISEFKNNISGLAGELRKKDISVEYMDVTGKVFSDINSIPFNVSQTDLTTLFNHIENAYEGKNISCIILASDGIYNTGTSPVYRNYKYPLIAIGLGDTTEKNDISIRAIYNNKIVYQGNRFSIVTDIFNKGYQSESTQVEIMHNGVSIESKNITFTEQRSLQQVTFTLNADQSGIQRYSIHVKPLPGEQTRMNNSRETFLEVIEAKEKILLLAHSPHPDIKAIKTTIESNENYELTVLTPDIGKYKPDQYNLVIYHQLPDLKGSFNDLVRNNKLTDLPSIYIIGGKTNLKALSDRIEWFRISGISTRSDNAFPIVNQSFSSFIISPEESEAIADFPPLSVPFGEYSMTADADVALFQKIENLMTSRPLLVSKTEGDKKITILAGEGIWRWKLNEYLEKNSHTSFNSFFLKVVQYTSSRQDRRKFRVYPVKNEFSDYETVEFETEAYNDIYERIYGQEVSLSISHENGLKKEFSYVTSETNTRFGISGIEPGVYHFSANTAFEGRNYSSGGAFTLQHQQIESVNLTADFSLLRKLAERSSGYFILPDEIGSVPSLPLIMDAKPVIYSSENITSLINSKWIFVLLLMLATAEWATRKYLGGY